MSSAPSGLTYPTPPAFVINKSIAPLAPTVTGTAISYTVAPSLPVGLSFASDTGTISGTPTAVTAKASYVVTASNASGSTTATVSIVVDDIPPATAYASVEYSFTKGISGQTDTPQNSGGKALSWSVSPALPDGLTLHADSGVISGTATAGMAVASYQVTATDSGGQSSSTVKLAVSPAPLLDLGHTADVTLLRASGVNLISQDDDLHWVLWNALTDTILASGDSPSFGGDNKPLPVDLAGSTAVIQTATGLEVRSAADGHVLGEIPATINWWRVASDGSYVCAGNSTSLTAWSPSGQMLFSRAGNYARAVVFAAPAQIQVAGGAAGPNVIETLSVPTGASSSGPSFNGTFQSWFVDGVRFISALGNTAWIYSSNGTQQQIISTLPSTNNLGGEGNWYWQVLQPNLALYAVGGGTQPVATYATNGLMGASGQTLGLHQSSDTAFSVVDLSGASPIETNYTLPNPVSAVSAYAATSSSAWLVANFGGLILDGSQLPAQSRYLDYGAALGFAGSATNFAIATQSGRILYFDASTNALLSTVDFASSSVALSADGTVLAALADHTVGSDATINVYTMPSGTLFHSFPYTVNTSGTPYPTSMVLSGDGTVLGEIMANDSACRAQTMPTAGGSVLWCESATQNSSQLQLSPDGTWAATSPFFFNQSTTNIYKNGVLGTTVPGWVLGWLDNNRLLTIWAKTQGSIITVYAGSTIYDSSGNKLSSPPLPELHSMQVLGPSSIYSPGGNAIYSLTSGTTLWTSASPTSAGQLASQGTVSGSEVIFVSGRLVLAEPY